MSSSLTRRKLVAGVAWAAPVVAASATVPSYAASVAADCTLAASPAYSISGTDEGAKTVKTFTVPNNVYKLRFELVGGAGGTNNRMTPAGSGAKVTGVVAVTPGSTVQILSLIRRLRQRRLRARLHHPRQRHRAGGRKVR